MIFLCTSRPKLSHLRVCPHIGNHLQNISNYNNLSKGVVTMIAHEKGIKILGYLMKT